MVDEHTSLIEMQTAARNKAKEVFKLYERLTIKYVFAKDKNDIAKMEECNAKETEILNMLETDMEHEAFDTLFLAEYKEYIFDMVHDPHAIPVEYDILMEYHAFVQRNYDEDFVYESRHDPTHFVFMGDNRFYSYYEMAEQKGKNVIDML